MTVRRHRDLTGGREAGCAVGAIPIGVPEKIGHPDDAFSTTALLMAPPWRS